MTEKDHKSAKRSTKDEEQLSEGAPELESPEDPKGLPDETSRDEQSPMETPEKPKRHSRAETARDETVVLTREGLIKHIAEHRGDGHIPLAGASDVQVIAELAVAPTTTTDPYVNSLFQHVAKSPVDAHAPVWTTHTPNTTGGYS